MSRSLHARHSRWMFRHFSTMEAELAEAERGGGVVWTDMARRFVAEGRADPGLRGGNLRLAWEAVRARKAAAGAKAQARASRTEVGGGGTAPPLPAGPKAAEPLAGDGEHALRLMARARRRFPGSGGAK